MPTAEWWKARRDRAAGIKPQRKARLQPLTGRVPKCIYRGKQVGRLHCGECSKRWPTVWACKAGLTQEGVCISSLPDDPTDGVLHLGGQQSTARLFPYPQQDRTTPIPSGGIPCCSHCPSLAVVAALAPSPSA